MIQTIFYKEVNRQGLSYQSFLNSLPIDLLYNQNCIKTFDFDSNRIVQSSPFIAAIATRIFSLLPAHPAKSIILNNTIQYLSTATDKSGRIGFLHPNIHRFDLDTLALVHGCLHDIGNKINADQLSNIIDIIFQNQNIESGAFYTWINKENNNIDYMVNLNISFFLNLLGYDDDRLIQYLAENANNFIVKGSHYYRDTTFPLIILSFYEKYYNFEYLHGNTKQIVEYILNHHLAINKLEKLNTLINSRIHSLYDYCPLGIQCFYSRDGSYYSHIIDQLLIIHSFCNLSYCLKGQLF